MITVNNLTKTYKNNPVLKGLNFHVKQGDIYGFLGKNGAGKSTTLNILTKMIKSNGGEFQIDSDNIGYLPESPMFYDYMTALEYMKFIKSLKKSNHQSSGINELLSLVGLTHAKNKRIKTFSRGMKQRLGLASILIHNPELILLDEPSSALDPQGRKDILDILVKLKNQGKTIFFSTHILEDVEKICNKIAILDDGVIKLESTVTDLMNQYIDSIYTITLKSQVNHELFYSIAFVYKVVQEENKYTLYLNEDTDLLLNQLVELPINISSFNRKNATLEDIFIRRVKNDI